MKIKKIFKYTLFFIGYAILALGVSFGIIIITGGYSVVGVLLNIYLPLIAVYFFIVFPVIIILLIRLHDRDKKYWVVPLILGGLVISFGLLPLVSIPYSTNEADTQFQEAYGSDYMDYIPDELKNKFSQFPFNFWELFDYFNLYPELYYNYTKDYGPYLTVPIFNDEFYFDYYCPKTGTGPFPTIINIHGGSFVAGGPGETNTPYVSQYLAHQGNVILDIQYGLGKFKDLPFINLILGGIQTALGQGVLNKSYTILEATHQILGNLTDYIVEQADSLKIDVDNIFVMGRSAGAGLAGMFYGYNSTKYPIYKSWFNQTLNLKGLILYYPPTNYTPIFYPNNNYPALAEAFFGSSNISTEILQSVSCINLVDEYSPPTLILHGTNDNIVPYYESQNLKNRLDLMNRTAILIPFPFYGHGYDLISNNPAAQTSLYYLERFLACTRYIT